MPTRLSNNLNSRYFEAANRLKSKQQRRRIVAYVESYDDIYFWRTVLSRFENSQRYFEVMLPSHQKLERGKKSVLMNFIGSQEKQQPAALSAQKTAQPAALQGDGQDDGVLGPAMIACVDADYDYLLQGATEQSRRVIESPYVFHTYAYAIENLQCYAPSLHEVCTGVTLNDHRIFDFEDYLRQYSEAVFPLFVWSIWAYRTGHYAKFTLSDLARVAEPGGFTITDPDASLQHLRRKVATKLRQLQRQYPDNKEAYLRTKASVRQLGVTPQTTYLYMQGHSLFDAVVVPILNKVCNRLRQERQEEIQRTAVHHTQQRNEMACYEHSLQDIRQMLRKNAGYQQSPPFQRIVDDLQRYLDGTSSAT